MTLNVLTTHFHQLDSTSGVEPQPQQLGFNSCMHQPTTESPHHHAQL